MRLSFSSFALNWAPSWAPDWPRPAVSHIAQQAGRGLAVVLITTLAAFALVSLAPGFGIDERLTDSTLGAETRAQISEQAAAAANRWGTSSAFDQPVAELIANRWRATVVDVLASIRAVSFELATT